MRVVLPGVRTVEEGNFYIALSTGGGGPQFWCVPLLMGGAAAAWGPSHAGAGNASYPIVR